jgi:hypothetical protein
MMAHSDAGRPVPLFFLPAVVGAVGLVLSPPMVRAGVEPFVTWYYMIAWYSLILCVDSVRGACGKRSLIFHTPLTFLCLIFWSAVIWFSFEACNFILANWYYIYAPDRRWEGALGSWLSFGTVLPALFLLEKLLEDLGLFRTAPRFSWKVGDKGVRLLCLLGVLCLALPLLFPRYAYPLIWAWGFLIPLPLTCRKLERPLLKDLAEGRGGRLLRILAAGMLCGLIWEFLNFFARIKWIYTVPFFEDLKIFEMPVLGFLGFPPFAVECTVLYGALVALGLAPPFGDIRAKARGPLAGPRIAVPAGVVGLCLGFFVLFGMELYTIDSFRPRPEALGFDDRVGSLIREGGYKDCFQFQKALDNPVIRKVLRDRGVDADRVVDLNRLCLLRGVGTFNARILDSVGVSSPEALARKKPDELVDAFRMIDGDRNPRVRKARAGVWIKAAKEWQP